MTDAQFLAIFADTFGSFLVIIQDFFDSLMDNVITRICIELAFLALMVRIVGGFVKQFVGSTRKED